MTTRRDTLPTTTTRGGLSVVSNAAQEYVTVRLAGQLLGIPVLSVHDVLGAQKLTRIPLAPKWVAGVLNLRGRIVTAINLRQRLGLELREDSSKDMSVVVEHNEESYSLQIDNVGEVLTLNDADMEKNPVTLDPRWREISRGIFRLETELLVIMDVEKLFNFESAAAA
ncbi:chemotaxis protein CheW [Rhodothalassium salexigens]|uniref:chemotaxis protein CheW n=1 Tax=Rhodothalassium salexigens TaxID=1086 RepID=UPI00191283C8|nr:chemotaxis protein CheW [Rhodothalassium salexigens]MBK5910982.1 chemotaxis protein CheW [Rhodothalassium salexigens]MBK5921239.1 chemotaxis protein CheW [Rhodothalassium salexigens]